LLDKYQIKMIATMLRTNNIVRVSEENTERKYSPGSLQRSEQQQQSLCHLLLYSPVSAGGW